MSAAIVDSLRWPDMEKGAIPSDEDLANLGVSRELFKAAHKERPWCIHSFFCSLTDAEYIDFMKQAEEALGK